MIKMTHEKLKDEVYTLLHRLVTEDIVQSTLTKREILNLCTDRIAELYKKKTIYPRKTK